MFSSNIFTLLFFYIQFVIFINNLLWPTAGLVTGSLTEDFNQIRNKRIVDGKLTDINKYPFQVALLIKKQFICSGSIITYKIILTAAHCVYDYDYDESLNIIVRAGSTNNGKGGYVSKINDVIIHEKYDNDIYDYDIAVLKLHGKGYYNEIINDILSVIKLPTISPFNMIPKPKYAYLAGWGTTNEDSDDTVKLLREIKVDILRQKACKTLNVNVTSRMLCAGYIEGGRDACQGDSGGPLVIKKNIIIGIVSWGNGCGQELSPSVFTHVYYLRNWIYKWM